MHLKSQFVSKEFILFDLIGLSKKRLSASKGFKIPVKKAKINDVKVRVMRQTSLYQQVNCYFLS